MFLAFVNFPTKSVVFLLRRVRIWWMLVSAVEVNLESCCLHFFRSCLTEKKLQIRLGVALLFSWAVWLSFLSLNRLQHWTSLGLRPKQFFLYTSALSPIHLPPTIWFQHLGLAPRSNPCPLNHYWSIVLHPMEPLFLFNIIHVNFILDNFKLGFRI